MDPPPESAPESSLCIRCGYSLVGLPVSGLCPECATPIERSLLGDLLVYSDPAYVRRLLLALRLILVGLLLRLVLSAGTIVRVISWAPSTWQLIPLAYLGVMAIFLFGWWRFTTPDLGQLSTNKGAKPRQVARVCILVVAAIHLLRMPLIRQTVSLPPSLTMAISLSHYAAAAAAFFSGMLYVSWLAPRIPSEATSRRALVLMFVMAAVFTLQVALSIAFQMLLPTGATMSGSLINSLSISSTFVNICDLVSTVMYVAAMAKLRKELLIVQTEQQQLDLPGLGDYPR